MCKLIGIIRMDRPNGGEYNAEVYSDATIRVNGREYDTPVAMAFDGLLDPVRLVAFILAVQEVFDAWRERHQNPVTATPAVSVPVPLAAWHARGGEA